MIQSGEVTLFEKVTRDRLSTFKQKYAGYERTSGMLQAKEKKEYRSPQVETGLAYCGKSKVREAGAKEWERGSGWQVSECMNLDNKFEFYSVHFRKPVDGSEQGSDIL